MAEFPKDFFWGAATSAYQVEGDNALSDWWEWEKRVGVKEPSGQACRHYELFRKDFDIAQYLHHTAHRFSVEWSRIEPEEGKFLEQEIRHYIEVACALRERGIEPVVTLHHFTNPLWLARAGGWNNRDSITFFVRYVERIVDALAPHVRFWVTINEPMVYVYHAYVIGAWPPQERSLARARKVTDMLADAHIAAYRRIHELYKKKQLPLPSVSIAHNMRAFVPCTPALKNRIAAYLRDRNFNVAFLARLIKENSLDYIGVNYYSRDLIDLDSWRMKGILLDACRKGHNTLEKNSLGWEIYPEGLYTLLLRLKRYGLPVFILENGICSDDDSLRWDFIRRHLLQVHSAMQQGAKVIGYLYWSLLDNFEWDKGFAPRFGLVDVDYRSFSRTIRASAQKLAEVCKTGTIE